MTNNTISKILLLLVLFVFSVSIVQAATLTCQQVSSASLSVPQFSSKQVEIRCTASGGSVTSISITPNADPSTGLTIVNSEAMSSSLSDQSSDTVKWTLTGDSPNTYALTYTVSSSATNSWSGASTTNVVVPSSAQLTVEYVLPPSLFTPSVETLDLKISNIGGTTANNVKLRLNDGSLYVYPTTIQAGASASYSWTNETGFNESGTYTTKVYIGEVLHDTAVTTVNTADDEAALNLSIGYNLISLQKVPENSSTPAVLSSITGSYEKLWLWDTATVNFKAHDPGIPFSFSQIQTMDVSAGYWIKMNDSDATLNESGADPTTTNIDLVIGYNLIGYPSTSVNTVSTAFASIAGNYEKVWKWSTGELTFKAYDPSIPSSFNTAFGNMTPGEGYWVKMNATDTLTVSN